MLGQIESSELSIVIASKVGAPFIDDCILSLEQEARQIGAEVLVVACASATNAQRIRENFSWVHVIDYPERETVPELRRIGVEQASGKIVAIIEEHCLASKNWLHSILEGFASGDYGAVGGPVADNAYERLTDWAVYFCEYNGYLPPWAANEAHDLNGANIAYKRQLLIDHTHILAEGYWEASLHPHLLAKGIKFLSIPGMIVKHRGPFPYGYYLRQRYWFSRAFAGARTMTMPMSRRLVYLLAAPVVPLVLLARMASRVWTKHCQVGKFLSSIPILIPALIVYAAGEWMGYLAGSGDALLMVE